MAGASKMRRDRTEIVRKLQVALERRGSPRADMALITAFTGASGFLVSFTLLRLGLERMWLRYLLALVAAYLVFFCLLRLWLHFRGRKLDSRDIPDLSDAAFELPLPDSAGLSGAGGAFGGGGASASFDGSRGVPASMARPPSSSAPDLDALDADEAAIPLLLVAALVGALLASLWAVYIAPSILAELLVDTALVGGLYHRLRRQSTGSWVVTALRSTALPFAATCLLFVLAGWFVQSRLPEARSIGEALRLLQSQR